MECGSDETEMKSRFRGCYLTILGIETEMGTDGGCHDALSYVVPRSSVFGRRLEVVGIAQEKRSDSRERERMKSI